MSRISIFVKDAVDRDRAAQWAMRMPIGATVEFSTDRRSLDQNAKLWAMLSEVAQQVEWYGQKLTSQDWKDVLTASLRKARVVPGIDAGTFVVLGLHTSKMTKDEFAQLLSLIEAFGAEHGVVFRDEQPPVVGEVA